MNNSDATKLQHAAIQPTTTQQRQGSAYRSESGPGAAMHAPDTANPPPGKPSNRTKRKVTGLALAGLAGAVVVVAGAGLVHALNGSGAAWSSQASQFSEFTSHAGIEYRLLPLGSTMGSPMQVEVRRLDPLDHRMVDERTGLSMVLDQRAIAAVQLTLNDVATDLVFDPASNAWKTIIAPSQISWFGSNRWVLVAKAIDGGVLARFERKLTP